MCNVTAISENLNLTQRMAIVMERLGWNQSDLARAADVEPATVSRWMTGRSDSLDAETAYRLAQKTGLPGFWLAIGKGATPDDIETAVEAEYERSRLFTAKLHFDCMQEDKEKLRALISVLQGLLPAPDTDADVVALLGMAAHICEDHAHWYGVDDYLAGAAVPAVSIKEVAR